MPIKGQPIRTTNTPPRKNPVAFTFCFWKKNLNVLSRPITKAKPATNRTWERKTSNTEWVKHLMKWRAREWSSLLGICCALSESCMYALQQSQAWGTHAGSPGCLHWPHSLSNPMQWRKMMKWDTGTPIGSSSPALLDRQGNGLKQTAGKAWMASLL